MRGLIDVELTDRQRATLAALYSKAVEAFAAIEREWMRAHPGEYPLDRQEQARRFISSSRSNAALVDSLRPPKRAGFWPQTRTTTVRIGRAHAEVLVATGVMLMSNAVDAGRLDLSAVTAVIQALAPLTHALQSKKGKRHRVSPQEVRSRVDSVRAIATARRRSVDAIDEIAAQLDQHPRTVQRALASKPKDIGRAASVLLSE